MKRWNGWGDVQKSYHLPDPATKYLSAVVGQGAEIPDCTLEEVIRQVPASRLKSHELISTDPEERVRHSRGQSLADWIALRSGTIAPFTDGVAFPTSEQDCRTIIGYARQTRAAIIPYGGGSSVVGHINPLSGDAPVLTVDMTHMNKMLNLNGPSLLATFEAGVRGPDLEDHLNSHGFTLGHFPQSFEFSTLGGWIVTRSCGQQSFRYGRIEDAFAGGKLETAIGQFDLPVFPASAAGPDLRHLILGSEGRAGLLTQATIRIHRLPEVEGFYAAFFPDWEQGTLAVREMVQQGLRVSMLRLSDAQETATTLALSGKEQITAWADRGLPWIGYGPARCLLIYGVSDTRRQARITHNQAQAVIRTYHGLPINFIIGPMWRKTRFTTPYLRNVLWERGYALDTLESALPWDKALATANQVRDSLTAGLCDEGERVLAFAHLSHVYRYGASFYVTYLYRRTADPTITLERWKRLKTAASQRIVDAGGTISHQHGVGLDHGPYLPQEKGPLGMQMIESCFHELDPDGCFNPGKLILTENQEHQHVGNRMA